MTNNHINNIFRNPTNNEIIEIIKQKYIIAGNFDRKTKKRIRHNLILNYKQMVKNIKISKQLNL